MDEEKAAREDGGVLTPAGREEGAGARPLLPQEQRVLHDFKGNQAETKDEA